MTKTSLNRVAAAAMTALLIACESAEPRDPTLTTQPPEYPPGSLPGGLIINEQPRLDRGWTVSNAPVLEIGAEDGPSEVVFSGRSSAVRMSDGRVAVLDGATREIRYFAGSGVHVRTVAGRGPGPGEFESPRDLIPLPGDSLAVFDALLRRVTVLDERGDVVVTVPVQVPEVPLQPIVFARLGDGSFLALATASPMYLFEGEGVGREGGWVWRIDPNGDPIARVSPYEEGILERYVAGRSTEVLPFDAYGEVAVWNDHVVHGNRRDYTFRVYDLDGTLDSVVFRRSNLQPVTSTDMSALRERSMESARRAGPSYVQSVTQLFDLPEIPESHAAFGPIIVDRLGYLWVGEYDPRPEGNVLPRPLPRSTAETWSVFDSEGVWVTVVDMPAGLVVTDIGAGYVLGIGTGDFGVSYVRQYQLIRG